MAIIADQWLIDRLVDSAYRGEQYAVDYDVLFDHDQDFSGHGAIEPFVAFSIDRLLNYWDLDLNDESLWDYVGHDGLKETLGHDDVLNDEARLAFITWRLHGQLEDPDSDLVPGVYAYEIEDSQGRKALVVYLSTGYSFTGISRSVIGAFPDEASIRQYLREDGYVVDEEGLYAEIGERKESLLDKWDYSYEPVIEQAEQVSRNRIFDDYDLQLIDSSDLWKRGWTRSMVRRFLPNSWGKRSGKNTYLVESIDNVENTLEFQDTLEKSLKRRKVDDDVLTAIKKERTRTRRMMKAYQKSQMQKVRTMFSRVMLRRKWPSGPFRQ